MTRPSGFGSYGGTHPADNPPGAPKLSSRDRLEKGRVGKEVCPSCVSLKQRIEGLEAELAECRKTG